MSIRGKIETVAKERIGLKPLFQDIGVLTPQGLPDKSVHTIALEWKDMVIGSALDKYKSEHPEES